MAQRAARASKGARRGPAGRRQAKKPPARKASDRRKRTIDARAKTIVVAAEPPIDRDPANLVPAFRERLEESLQALEASGTPFKFVEGFRTVERQQWLYGSGRPGAPFGRQGAILTFKDGVKALSNHQGDGTPGSGRAADCYPVRDGRVYIPKASEPVWKAYADAVQALGLVAGFYWKSFQDAPHCELSPTP
jgi:hypothetical protein